MNGQSPEFDEQKFRPTGAIAFFTLMLSFFIVVWLVIYALMIERS